MTMNNRDTAAVLRNHRGAVRKQNVEEILIDYVEDAVLFTPDGSVRGLDELRNFFTGLFANAPAGFPEGIELLRKDIEGDLAYIVWRCGEGILIATDTFVVRDGKIHMQTFAAHIAI